MKNNLLWVFIFLAVAINHIFHFVLTKAPDGYALYRALPLLNSVRYGDYLTQKWFLVVVAFIIFTWWLVKQKNLIKAFKRSLSFAVIIALVVFGVHSLSYSGWFEFDDYRVIGHHYAVEGTPRQNQMGAGSSYYYGIGIVYLVVGWFGTRFELYNTLGLFIYFLIGLTVFVIARKLEVNKFVALFIALFFVTSPTYFRETLIMLELLGDGFKLLLFSLSCLLLIYKFYPGSVIFAAAALEFGISRTHFIGLPLILMTVLLKKKEVDKGWIISLIAFFVMSFLYIEVLGTHPPQVIDTANLSNNLPQLARIGDTIFGVTVPHPIAYTAIYFLRWLFNDYPYISPIFGAVIVGMALLISLLLFLKDKILPAKLIFLGTVMAVAAIIFPTLMGIRLSYKIESLTRQYEDIVPTAPTSYGVFSALGLVVILIGSSKVVKGKAFRRVLIFLVILNAITILKSDWQWAKQYSIPQRRVNVQLSSLLPYDGKAKVIYTPPPTQILSNYISYFYQLYRIKESLNFTNDPTEFIKLLETYKPEKDHVYLLILDTETHEVINFSDRVREYYPNKKLTPELLKTFTK